MHSREIDRGQETVVISLRGPGATFAESGPASVTALRAHGLLVNGGAHGAVVVPDGVLRVILDHFRLLTPRGAGPVPVTAAVSPVSDNVAHFRLAAATERGLALNPRRLARWCVNGTTSAGRMSTVAYELPASARITWLNGIGATLRRSQIGLSFRVLFHTRFSAGPRLRCGRR